MGYGRGQLQREKGGWFPSLIEGTSMYEGKRVSVFTTCQNRTSFLLQALPTWLTVKEIDEVVVVDWASDVPLEGVLSDFLKQQGDRLVLGVVPGPRRWHLTKCGNLAISLTTGDLVLHLDADVMVRPIFSRALSVNSELLGIEPRCFRAMYPNRGPLWGSFLAHKRDLLAVNGYNERIIGYAQDDEDLYNRLSLSGCHQEFMFHEYLQHIDHSEDLRLNNQTETITETLIRARQVMRDAPWTVMDRPTRWHTDRQGNVVYCTEEL